MGSCAGQISSNMCQFMCYIHSMKRTNFYFPEQMLERLAKAKKKLGIPVSQFIRNAVDEALKKIGL